MPAKREQYLARLLSPRIAHVREMLLHEFVTRCEEPNERYILERAD